MNKKSVIDHIVVQPHVWFICGVGKRARVTGWAVCRDRGASSIARVEIAGIRTYEWNTAISLISINANWEITPKGLTTFRGGMLAWIDVVLQAGETIETTQNSGVNAEFDLYLTIEELPI